MNPLYYWLPHAHSFRIFFLKSWVAYISNPMYIKNLQQQYSKQQPFFSGGDFLIHLNTEFANGVCTLSVS